MTTSKMLPCSLYDIQGLQNWLDEMALQGLFFESFSKRNDAANFRVDTPRPVRYRADPVGKSKKEDQRRKEPYAQMGWQFVDTQPQLYYIFSCDDPEVPELHSDPQTLAYALGYAIQKQTRSWGVMALASFSIIGVLLFVARVRFLEDLLLVEEPRLLVQLAAGILILFLCVCFGGMQIRILVRTRRLLEQGLPMKAGRRWNRPRYLTVYFCVFVPLYLILFFAVPSYAPEVCGLEEAELSHTWPTIAQLEGTGPRPLSSEPAVDGYVRQNSSWAVPVQENVSIDWRVRTFDPETGDISTLERPYTLWLDLQYDHARSLRAARQVYQIRRDEAAKELERALSYQHQYRVTDLGTFETVDHPGLDRLETVRFRRADQDSWLFAALRGRDILVVEYAGFARMEDCLPLFLAALDR